MKSVRPDKVCPYCGSEARKDGTTIHDVHCEGLTSITLSKIRLYYLTDGKAAELTEAQGEHRE